MPTQATDRDILAERFLDAPRARVFEAFRDPERLARWWGPRGFRNTFQEFDFRPGGAWRFVMHGPNGADYPNQSSFLELSPERIVIRHLSAPRFDLTITLGERGNGTSLTWLQRFETAAERDKVAGFARDANEQNLDRLEAELATMG